MNSIPFNKSPVLGTEIDYIRQAIESRALCGDGIFSKRCEVLLTEMTSTHRALMVPSCTAALELSAILIDIQPGDEVILPSFTFVSTANAYALRGAKLVFVDIEKDSMNLDPKRVEEAITDRTKAIVVVHYAGMACKMDEIMQIAEKNNIYVIEDAAQAIGNHYRDRALGSIGHLGTFSFHETKNITSGGEGGALLINDEKLIERAEIIREKGTNRKLFLRGVVDKYSWVDIGSSFLPSEIQCAYLLAQLENIKKINGKRLALWNTYAAELSVLEEKGIVTLPSVPEYTGNNAHIFFLKCKNIDERSELITYLRNHNVAAVFHYVPLHSSKYGKTSGFFHGADHFTTCESEKLVRLPLYFELTENEVKKVCSLILEFFGIKA
ncbi:4-keto-6-deoxy-N-Acetyl-D-hexosaminyl-(Lipid carrier) aminotransferase [Grimontia indica]|uniref:4-keto-6-deoxy-N-Acetyl-D-hexosaminyl-(Lipid carrier) aminotransferase n=1 Tax=Grimontia indica TaxID=1056512 RepID=R1IHB0_9GAMM|nr:dTDP-4-amino-4,6-dideoxygalactose transaminase [Grimontia indica]EOD80111.1 4-keto-6-deoxy-N-Acetyl-D-hexosaminyl-(Lipid carrier) aminotransferase [Grimontia indica]